jgi:putative radical SAM enzyme (TIGR03279 family)
VLEIISVQVGSIAEQAGFEKGDKIVRINENEINDQIDFRFNSADEYLKIVIQRGQEQFLFEIEKDFDDDIGLELQEMKMKACGNNCIFCFVYQNPRGMRKALYFKDEDYRFSFLYGHYVTLTRVNQEELQRIVKQKLSPLYISVHSTEEKTRKLLLGIDKDDHLIEKIEYLVQAGIELHAQIVLCPGINEGAVLQKTVNDLKKYFPGVKSIAVVPVGLTRYRDKLFPLRIHTTVELNETIVFIEKMRKELYKELGVAFIYVADEFFIKAQVPIPDTAYYDDFYQIENGVGEFRYMIDEFHREFSDNTEEIKKASNITWVTGTLAAELLQENIISELNRIRNISIKLISIRNKFYGEDISVSGLLVGQDIYNQLRNRSLGDLILLPPRILNHQGLLLDDWKLSELEEKLNVPCYVYKEKLAHLAQIINKIRVRI